MSTTYSSYKELKGKTLKIDDEVMFIFEDNFLRYGVRKSWITLLCHNSSEEQRIFIELGIENHNEYCTSYYGYDAVTRSRSEGAFPDCKMGDMEALTRVVKALFKVLESKKFKKKEEVKPKFTILPN